VSLSFPRRAVTSISWSKSCARPRGSRPSSHRCPNPSRAKAAAEAARAITPASPTTLTKVCFWRTRSTTPSHTREGRMLRTGDRSRKPHEYLKGCERLWTCWRLCCVFSVFLCRQTSYHENYEEATMFKYFFKPEWSLPVGWFVAFFFLWHLFLPRRTWLTLYNHWRKKPSELYAL